jgi:hypothetical protein
MPVILLNPSSLGHNCRKRRLMIKYRGPKPSTSSYVYAHPEKIIKGIAAVGDWRNLHTLVARKYL